MRQLRFVMFFLTTVCVFAAHGSEWKVECELRDSLTGEGEPFATVRVDFYPPTKQAASLRMSARSTGTGCTTTPRTARPSST